MWDVEDTGDLAVDVGRRVKRLREIIADVKQPEFADAIGLSQPHLSMIETGVRPLAVDVAIVICARHNVTLDWLYRGDPNGLPVAMNKKLIAAAKPHRPS